MCYDPTAKPPVPDGEKFPARGEDIVLKADDGSQFAAFVARSSQPSKAQVVIYPDVRGLHQFYKELALRFAEVGINAIAIDYFGRTAGLTARDESFEFRPHVNQIELGSFSMDVHSALAYLAQEFGPGVSTVVVGFCMGGTLALLTGTDPSFGFAGLIPFYAGLTRDFGGQGTALENAVRVKYPVLGLFGGADQGIPVEAVERLDAMLDASGIGHEIKIYPGAPHSFFDRKYTEFAEASGDAWRQMLAFIARIGGAVQRPAAP